MATRGVSLAKRTDVVVGGAALADLLPGLLIVVANTAGVAESLWQKVQLPTNLGAW